MQINQNQFDALVSFVFNLGQTTFIKSSVLRLLNANNFPGAIIYLKRYVHADGKKLKGLVRRREAEANLFNS
jgi:lysozyme